MERAGFFPRAAALLVDLLVFMAGAHLAMIADVLANQLWQTHDFGTVSGIGAILVLLAFATMEVVYGASPGKWAMRLTLAGEDQQPAARAMLLRRAVAKYAGFLLSAFPIYLLAMTGPYGGFSWMPSYMHDGFYLIGIVDAVIAGCAIILITAGCFRALRPDGRALHDLAAGTAVFHKPNTLRQRGFTPVLPMEEIDVHAPPAKSDPPV